MSTVLYALGRWAIRARALVLIIWIAILALLGAGAGIFGQGANGPITIPGTESQAAIDSLSHTFPEVSGTSATVIAVAADGDRIEDEPYRQAIIDAADTLELLDGVNGVQHPFAELAPGGLADGSTAALLTVQIEGEMMSVSQQTADGIRDVSAHLQDTLPEGSQASYGGEIFSSSVPGISPAEGLGVIIAFIVLVITLGSLIAAGMPLIIAMIGVGVSIAGIFFVTAFVELTSTTPMLALMLGLAVGIDYTLFIVSRHQEQLRSGVPLDESIARATATSGSAVVFAGLTVIIALVGLFVAGIPFLTALGVAAAVAVAIAVAISVTLTPALMSMIGVRILPKKQRAAYLAGELHSGGEQAPTRADRFFAGWVKAAVRRPVVTIIAVLAVLGIASIPVADLRLALPTASSLEATDPARVTYELTGEHFGEGHNGPLLLTGSIITSEDPLGLLDDLTDEVLAIPGVAEVPLATPNMGADTAIIQVVPEDGPHAESTTELVHSLRDMHDTWEAEYGVSLAVTGFTAVAIDVSELLMFALIPFGIFVVGLSLVLLAMVFRSVWVPIKATLGFLLSVGTAFGAVVAVFQWGWFADLLNVHSTGPILSFMPIIIMGVLFGLAMDYEVFLVARIREEYVHGSDAQTAIRRGFVGSAKVVTAAALIMFAVFAAFVPEGDPSIKVIALGLAVGVAVDAFVVRMTLVPAVLALLGDRAWRMPKWLSRILPSFDVEGEALSRELAYAEWPQDRPDARIAATDARLDGGVIAPELRVGPGEALILSPHDPASVAIAEAVTGRRAVRFGTCKVDGLLLPERATSLRARSAWATVTSVREALSDRPAIVVLDLREFMVLPPTIGTLDDLRSALAAAFVDAKSRGVAAPLVVVLGDQETADHIVPDELDLVFPGTAPVPPEGAAVSPAPAMPSGHTASEGETR